MIKKFNKKQIILFGSTIGIAFLIRIILVHLPGYERDIFWFSKWCLESVKHGVVWIYSNIWCDYTPGYIYVLNIIGKIYEIFSSSLKEGTLLLQYLIKMPAILADLGTSILIFFIVKKRWKFYKAYLAMLFYALNPAIFINSAWWGQVDSIMVFVLLGAVYLLLNKKEKWSYILLAIACFLKSQALIFIPLFLYITWRKKGVKSMIRGISFSLGSVFVLSLPFILKNQMSKIVDVYFSAVGGYPYASMNAHNFWWFITGGKGNLISDKYWLFSLGSYKTIGFLLFFTFYAALIAFLHNKNIYKKFKEKKSEIYFVFALLPFAFYMLFTQMHERYIFPFFAFMILASTRKTSRKISYILISLISSLSLLSVLLTRYPNNSPFLANLFNNFDITVILSVLNIGIFIYFVCLIFKGIKTKNLIIGLLIFGLILLGLNFKNSNGEISLIKLQPISKSQDWGEMHIGESVNGKRMNTGGFIYFKGIGTHANSEITYHLNKNFTFFKTSFGLDWESNCNNRAEFIIKGDGKILYKSGEIGHKRPRHIEVLVKGIEKLSLITKAGKDGINCDHTNWLNPILIP